MELIDSVVQAKACKPFGRMPISSVTSGKLRDVKQASTMSLHRVDASRCLGCRRKLFSFAFVNDVDVAEKITAKRKTDVRDV